MPQRNICTELAQFACFWFYNHDKYPRAWLYMSPKTSCEMDSKWLSNDIIFHGMSPPFVIAKCTAPPYQGIEDTALYYPLQSIGVQQITKNLSFKKQAHLWFLSLSGRASPVFCVLFTSGETCLVLSIHPRHCGVSTETTRHWDQVKTEVIEELLPRQQEFELKTPRLWGIKVKSRLRLEAGKTLRPKDIKN